MAGHGTNCECSKCRTWFDAMAGRSGRCGRCSLPIDDHAKDKVGLVTSCPDRRVTA